MLQDLAAISDVTVEREAGAAVIRWRPVDAQAAVDVASGTTPDPSTHEPAGTSAPGASSFSLVRTGPAPLYISLTPQGGGATVVAGERRLPFDGLTNFRDLGGYPAAGGATVRWGCVFRSDALYAMTESDRTRFDLLGISAVYDLRNDSERAERPNPLPSLQLTLAGRPADPGTRRSGATADDGEDLLRSVYLELLEFAAPVIGEVVSSMARGGLPAVIHCHAGKDRTGVVVAALLTALGVERAVILDDYELTSRYRLRAQQEGSFTRLVDSGLAPEAAAAVLGTPRWAMADALDFLDRDHGGIERYLVERAGVHESDIGALRDLLLDPAAPMPAR